MSFWIWLLVFGIMLAVTALVIYIIVLLYSVVKSAKKKKSPNTKYSMKQFKEVGGRQ